MKIYNMIITKEHLNSIKRQEVKLIQNNMNSRRIKENLILNMKSQFNILFVIFIFIISVYVIKSTNIIDMNSLICMINDSSDRLF
jgi:hypothetical protein